MLRVLCTNGATERVLVATVSAARWMAPAEDAAVFAKARFTSLQLPPLLDARLPEVVTDVAEVRGTEAKIMCLPLAAIPALPSKELSPMLGTLQLALRSTTSAHELHGEGSLHVVVQIFLLLHIATLYLAAVIRLVALRAFKESHLCHCECGDFVLVGRVVRSRQRPALFDYPALQRLSPYLLVHVVLRRDNSVDARMPHYSLAERAPDVLKSQPASSCVPFPDHGLRTMLVQDMTAGQPDGRCAIERLRPANGAPLVAIWKFR